MEDGSGKIKDAAEAVKGIVEAVPIYQDALQPAAKQIGSALETVAKTIHIALAPISGLVWGFEKIKDFVSNKVSEKLKDVPINKIQTPDPTVAGPALEALKYTGHKDELREMYANLLANAMFVDKSNHAHPGFVDIIKNMTTDEARIIQLLSTKKRFPIITTKAKRKDGGSLTLAQNISMLGLEAKCENSDFCPNYIGNLCRLGLLRIPPLEFLVDNKHYEPIENQPFVLKQKEMIKSKSEIFSDFEIEKKYVELTEYGEQFSQACIYPPHQK